MCFVKVHSYCVVDGVCRNLAKQLRCQLAANATVDAKDAGGDTPLHWAAILGYATVAEVLVCRFIFSS